MRKAVSADAATDTIGETGIDAVATETTVRELVVDSGAADELLDGGGAAPRTGRRWIGMEGLTPDDAIWCCWWAAAAAAANDSCSCCSEICCIAVLADIG